MTGSRRLLKFAPSDQPRQECALAAIAESVEHLAARDNWDPGLAFNVNLVLDELASNILAYGGGEEAAGPDIEIEIASKANTVWIEVSDNGTPFNPLRDAPPAPAIDETTVIAPVGGLGVHLVRRLVDDLAYRREGGRNRLTMVARGSTETEADQAAPTATP